MAKSKRKRRSKHRGTPGGRIEARGRTGKQGEKKPKQKSAPASQFSKPPTWRGSISRALIATAIFCLAMLLLLRKPVQQVLPLSVLMFLVYIPLSYSTESAMYRRHLMKQQRKAAAKK